MSTSTLTRADFINRILVSSFAGEKAKRFAFGDGEVAVLYTLSRKTVSALAQPVVLFIATFPPVLMPGGLHDFGIDSCELPVPSAEEAKQLLAHFDHAQAALFRTKCQVARA